MVELTSILGVLLTFLGTIAGSKALSDWLERRAKAKKDGKNEVKLIKGLEDLDEIYTIIETIKNVAPICRVFLLKGSNGGGLPIPGNEFYAHGVHQSVKGTNDTLYKYIKVLVDAQYINMLLGIIKNKKISYIIDTMPEGLLKNIYISEGIKKSDIYFIGYKGIDPSEKFEMIYISVSAPDIINYTLQEQLTIDLAIDKIRQIFNMYGYILPKEYL